MEERKKYVKNLLYSTKKAGILKPDDTMMLIINQTMNKFNLTKKEASDLVEDVLMHI